jgi:hypothetical protein
VSGDVRPSIAADYLASVRKHKVTHLPPSVMVREIAELRRQLGQVLDFIEDQGHTLTGAQRATVLAALEDAIAYRSERATAWCEDCQDHPAQCCDKHADDLDRADAYRALTREIGGA